MANTLRWSVAGKLIELKHGLGGVTVLVDGAPSTDKLKGSGEFSVPFGGEQLTLRRKSGFMGVRTELLRNGVAIPSSATLVRPQPAANGAACATHPGAPAALACPTCGTFICASCESPDGARCHACFGKAVAKADADRKAMAYMTPAFVFIPFFGLIGGLVAAGAGALAVVVAKTDAPKAAKIGAAIALYVVALVVTIVIAAAIHGATH